MVLPFLDSMGVNSLFGKTPYGYRPLPKPSNEKWMPAETESTASTRNLRKIIAGTVLGTIVLVIILFLAASAIRASETHSLTPIFPRHCGSTPTEARSLGCKFEVHNFAWVAPECYNAQLSAEWDSDPTWAFSRTSAASPSDLYTREEAYSGDLTEAWVPWRQHVAHCAFVVRKYQQAVEMGGPMDNWTSSGHHMEHCVGNFLRTDIGMGEFNSILHLKFPVCDFRWTEGL